MTNRPNILFLMVDQMQARVLEAGHPCKTPNLDRLAARGVRFARAYTPNAICSPARASLMTGLLPHNHGVVTVTHVVDNDQSRLRTDKPHWAQSLTAAGYRTAYVGKWHVERSLDMKQFGWQMDLSDGNDRLRQRDKEAGQLRSPETFSHEFILSDPPGYSDKRFAGVTSTPPELRRMGVRTAAGLECLDELLAGSDPWCCFVSVNEPHDPFICGRAAFNQYDVDAIDLPASANDELAGRPGIYRKAARVWRNMTDRQKRTAATCYYASITEIDEQYGRLLDKLEQAGRLDDTIVVFTADHGEHLGAHGLYCKNFGAGEEVYNIPLIVAGPGVTAGAVTDARVGLHDLCQTLLELAGCETFDVPDSRSFANVLREGPGSDPAWQTGYAEFYGGRMILTQRVVWDGPWKFVFNGFDFDELYNLNDDPHEMTNLAERPDCQDRLRKMTARLWRTLETTGDSSLLNSEYPILRVAPFGPAVSREDG